MYHFEMEIQKNLGRGTVKLLFGLCSLTRQRESDHAMSVQSCNDSFWLAETSAFYGVY